MPPPPQPPNSAQSAVAPGAPVRTCVGCRQHGLRSDLIRLVLPKIHPSDGVTPVEVVVDERKILPGRGAWLHRSNECMVQAKRRQAISRALRAKAETTEIERYLTQEAGNRPMGIR